MTATDQRRALFRIAAGALAAGAIALALTNPAGAQSILPAQPTEVQSKGAGAMTTHPYVGMWVTLDGRIRHELLPNGRYDEARGDRKSAYQGRYEVLGNHIDYWDDTGFTADGTFVSDVELHHGGMIFRRER
jgi:Agrobacterium tumefaciens protein Atu4866